MDPEEIIFELLMQQLGPQAEARSANSVADPRDEAHALLLSRLAQQEMAQDVTAPSSFSGRDPSRGPTGTQRATALTSFADLGNFLNAVEDRDLGGAALSALIGLVGAGALGAGGRFLKTRKAARAGKEVVEEGGSAISQLQRELRERRVSELERRGAPREGPRGRRASDEGAEQLMSEVDRIVAQDILDKAQRAAQIQARGATDPVTELMRLLNPPR